RGWPCCRVRPGVPTDLVRSLRSHDPERCAAELPLLNLPPRRLNERLRYQDPSPASCSPAKRSSQGPMKPHQTEDEPRDDERAAAADASESESDEEPSGKQKSAC